MTLTIKELMMMMVMMMMVMMMMMMMKTMTVVGHVVLLQTVTNIMNVN